MIQLICSFWGTSKMWCTVVLLVMGSLCAVVVAIVKPTSPAMIACWDEPLRPRDVSTADGLMPKTRERKQPSLIFIEDQQEKDKQRMVEKLSKLQEIGMEFVDIRKKAYYKSTPNITNAGIRCVTALVNCRKALSNDNQNYGQAIECVKSTFSELEKDVKSSKNIKMIGVIKKILILVDELGSGEKMPAAAPVVNSCWAYQRFGDLTNYPAGTWV